MKHIQEGRTMTHTMSFEDCISKIICEIEGMKLKAVTGDYDGMMKHMQRIDSIVFPNIVDV